VVPSKKNNEQNSKLAKSQGHKLKEVLSKRSERSQFGLRSAAVLEYSEHRQFKMWSRSSLVSISTEDFFIWSKNYVSRIYASIVGSCS
jgi:hypothetical protein